MADAKITIRPYIDYRVENMGLTKHDLVLFDGMRHDEQLMCLEQNGIKRYVTGLNEFAPEVRMLPEDEQTAKIKQIRAIVADLEKTMASNVIDPTDPEFWNKVKLLRPDNESFWNTIEVKVTNDPVFLEPTKNPEHLILLQAIEAGGFSSVAPSLEAARDMASPPKFFLDKLQDTIALKTEVKKLRNKALSELQKLFDKNANKLFYVAKVIDPNSAQYKKSTPLDTLYDNLDNFINAAGNGPDSNKRKAAEQFLETVNQDMETLKLRAMVKDATFYKFIAARGDGFIYHTASSTMLGKRPTEIVEFLKNPLHEDVLQELTSKLEQNWNK